MSNLSLFAVLLCVVVCLGCDVDLHYRTNNGNYLIVNPDSDTYQGIQAYDASGAVCTTTVIEIYAFSVENCGLVGIQVNLLYSNDSVATTCTISAAEAELTQDGVSVPLNFVMTSNNLLRSGSAHYHCNIQAEGSTKESSVLIKNPRNELYDHARAQDAEGNECTITFLLDNQVIEIKQCTVNGFVTIVVSSQPITGGSIIIARQTGIFSMDCGGAPPPAPVVTKEGEDNGMTYSCYDDGTIVAVNPRSELFCESYAEQNGEVCASTYVKTFSQVIISGCDHEQIIFLVLSKLPIDDDAMVIRPNNVFILDCSA